MSCSTLIEKRRDFKAKPLVPIEVLSFAIVESLMPIHAKKQLSRDSGDNRGKAVV